MAALAPPISIGQGANVEPRQTEPRCKAMNNSSSRYLVPVAGFLHSIFTVMYISSASLCKPLTIFYIALCLNPSNPSNGQVTSAGNSVGDTATYTCNTGFELIGQAVATCTQASDRNSATIVPAPPVCQGK